MNFYFKMKENTLKQATYYNAMAKYGTMIIQIIITMVLARIILPEEYGVVAVLTVMLGFFYLIADMGLGISIIQHPEMDKKNQKQLFSFSIFVGFFISIVVSLLSYPLSSIYNNDVYFVLCPIISSAAFFNSANIVPNAMLIRDKRFDLIAIRSLVVNFLTGFFAIILAYAGVGVYALIFQAVFSSLAVFLWNYYNYPLKLSKFGVENLKNLLGKYSLYQFIFNILNYFTRNTDNLVIGAKMGDVSLGYYNKAYTLNLYPNMIFTSVITGVLHPYLRDEKDDYIKLLNKLTSILKMLSICGVLVMIVCYFASYEIINIFFGPNWNGAVSSFQMLSLCIWSQMLLSVAGSVFLGIERTDQVLKCGIINVVSMVITIAVLVQFNSLGIISLGVSILYNLIFIWTYYILISQTLKESYVNFMKKFYLDFVAAIIFILFTQIFNIGTDNLFLSLFVKIIICISYFLMYLLLSNQLGIIQKIIRLIIRN